MKQPRRLILSAACLLALLAVGALAQEPDPREVEKRSAAAADAAKLKDAAIAKIEAQFRGEALKVVGPKFGFETKVVKGAPYSATAEAETVQTLADGNRITSKTTTAIYRDGEGRTRREGAANKQGVATEVFINDPAAGANYFLDPQRRVAVKSEIVNLKEIELAKMKRAQVEMKQQTQESGQVVQGEGLPKMKKRRPPVPEPLGKQVIEGVECEGTRTTFTIPAGEIGNDLPITVVSEQWYSPELQVFVLTRQRDPRIGETTYRLTNINRSEPDRALFEAPSDYTIRDEAKERKMKSAGKPEEER